MAICAEIYRIAWKFEYFCHPIYHGRVDTKTILQETNLAEFGISKEMAEYHSIALKRKRIIIPASVSSKIDECYRQGMFLWEIEEQLGYHREIISKHCKEKGYERTNTYIEKLRERGREATLKAWQDPVIRERFCAPQRTPEARAARSARAKKLWTTAEYREKRGRRNKEAWEAKYKEEKDLIQELAEGRTWKEVAELMEAKGFPKRTGFTYKKWARARGVSFEEMVQKSRIKPEISLRIKQLRECGYTFAKIGREVGFEGNTVRKHCKIKGYMKPKAD